MILQFGIAPAFVLLDLKLHTSLPYERPWIESPLLYKQLQNQTKDELNYLCDPSGSFYQPVVCWSLRGPVRVQSTSRPQAVTGVAKGEQLV